ncbi:kelch repeat-containing protein [Antarcticibacterium sp. 1MA-6-2]|uniref:kelch repeat-containing protein n=1 Tax=Antarcticibacterium sp. 1MA-6-2 TaxID=2908210 RepID=UPI001F211600|nr:kelch repeat-containing protein [Antarcticibacterium sp. 1MA-6-2]UJH92613.1 kelch repeat-containing protein [Antarcticibacterium sp. 1MA-6-2]
MLTAAAVYNDTYLVIGGESDTQEVAHNEVESLDPVSGTWKELTPLQTYRHGTQAVYLEDNIIVGAGSGNRGGGPELTSFEILPASDNSDITFDEFEVSSLKASKDSLSFGSGNPVQELILTNPGEKSIVISYLQLNNAEGFQLKSELSSPIIVGPRKTVKIQISSSGTAGNSSAKILIKTLGDSKPLEITLSR